jgi:hypothetical protein
MKITTKVGAAAVAFTIAAAAPATAASPRVQVSGLGTYGTATSVATYEADLYGRPYSGYGAGTVDLGGAAFPAPGSCEPATATLQLVDEKGKGYSLTATGSVCGEYLPLGVMQRFRGRYEITSASQRGLTGTVGHLDLRLLNGEVSVYAIQS